MPLPWATLFQYGDDASGRLVDLLKQVESSASPFAGLVVFGGSFAPLSGSSLGAVTNASRYQALRAVIPRTGTLNALAIYVGTSSGNVEVGVLDTTLTTRNVLYTTGQISCPTGGQWSTVGSPSLAVTVGQHVDLFVSADNTSATFGRIQGWPATAMAQLPTGFMTSPQGGLPYLISQKKTTGFPLGSTVAESDIQPLTTSPVVIGYVT